MSSLRTLFAGFGSSGALLAGIVAAFVAVGALVAFNGLPGGTAEVDEGTVIVQSDAPEAAAVAAVAPDATPAATPAPVPAAAVGGEAATGTGLDFGGGGGNGGPGSGPPVDPSPDPPPPPGPIPPVPPGPTAGLVGDVNNTVNDSTGVNLGLDQATRPITDLLDGTIKGITGGRGGSLGLPRVGDLP